MPPAQRDAWAEIIAAERKRSGRRSVTVWHHGSPLRQPLDVPDPPIRSGRFHRVGGRPTWYGSSSEVAAWAEFIRSLPDGVDPSQMRRRIARIELDVVALDLTSPVMQAALGVTTGQLTADDLEICQTIADLAVAQGFDAILAPSAAAPDAMTVAVFGPAIRGSASKVVDRGVRTPPSPR